MDSLSNAQSLRQGLPQMVYDPVVILLMKNTKTDSLRIDKILAVTRETLDRAAMSKSTDLVEWAPYGAETPQNLGFRAIVNNCVRALYKFSRT